MNTENKSTISKRPTIEDRERLVKLSEEIAARATEVALILGRVQQKDRVLPIQSFSLSFSPLSETRNESPLGTYRFHEVTFQDGSKLCHDFESRVSCSGPCPC